MDEHLVVPSRSQTISAGKSDRNVMLGRTTLGYGGHRRSDSGSSSSHQLFGAASLPAAGLSSSGGSLDFVRASSYQDKSPGESDGRFKTQQRIRALQLELAEKQVALLQEQDKRLDAEQRLLVSIDHSKRAAAINQFVFKTNARLQQELSDARNEVDRVRKEKMELYAAFKAVSEKVEADLMSACAAAPTDVRSHLEAALRDPMDLLRASGGMDERSSTPTQLSDALSVMKLAPGTPAETEESTDRIPSPSDSISISSVRSGADAGPGPAAGGAAGAGGTGPANAALSGLTVEQIESLGDMADFQASDTLLQKMAEGVDLLVGPNGLGNGALEPPPRRPPSPRATPPPRLLQTMDSPPSASYSREIFPAPSSPPAARTFVHRRTISSQTMQRSSSGSNMHALPPASNSFRFAPPASRAFAAHSYVGPSRSGSMNPPQRSRSREEPDDALEAYSQQELRRAESSKSPMQEMQRAASTKSPQPRILSPHQGVRKRGETTPGTFGGAPSTPIKQEAAPVKPGSKSPSPVKGAGTPAASPKKGKAGDGEGTEAVGQSEDSEADSGKGSGSEKRSVVGKLGKVAKRSWFNWSKPTA